MTQLVTITVDRVPTLVTAAGDRAAYRFLEFFTAQIRNPNTRCAYVRAVGAFLAWLEAQGVASIAEASSLHVAACRSLWRRHAFGGVAPIRMP